jgi:hypothetical protein
MTDEDLADETILESREMNTTTRIYQEESSTVGSAKKVEFMFPVFFLYFRNN